MPDYTISLLLKGVDSASGPIGKVERALKDLSGAADAPNRALGTLTATAQKVGTSASGVTTVGQALHGLTSAAAAPFKAVGGLVDVLGKIGLGALGVQAVVGAFAGLAGAVASPIKAASDLSESINKVDVVFGKSSAQILAFGETAAKSLGQSKQGALEAAGTFGNLFVALGLTQPAAAGLSQKIVTLGSDLASFNNIRPEEALEKLRAGLVGEAEPLRALGVNLTAATVEAEGLRLKLPQVGGELTEAAKVQARYSLILQQTGSAQGDFARTSDGLANSTRILQAGFADIRAEIGGKLLPVVAPLVSAFALTLPGAFDLVRPALDRVASGFTDFIQEGRTLAQTAQNIAGTSGLGLIPSALTAVELRIGEVFGPRAQTIFHNLRDAVEKVPGVLDSVGEALSPLVSAMASLAVDGIDALARNLPGVMDAFRDGVQFLSDHETAVKGVAGAYIALRGASALGGVATLLGSVAKAIALLNPYTLAAGVAIAALGAAYATNTGGMTGHINTMVASVGKALAELGVLVGSTGARFGAAADEIGQQLASARRHILNFMKAGDEMVTAVAAAMGRLGAAVVTKLGEAVVLVQGLAGRFQAAAGEIGTGIVTGMINGITGGNAGVIVAAGNLAASAIASAKAALGIASPSKPFAEMGENVDASFVAAIESGEAAVVSAITDLMDDATTAAEASIDALGAAMGAKFEKTFSLVEAAQNAIDNEIADATRAFHRTQELDERKHLRRLADLSEELGRTKGDARKGVLQRIAQLHEDYARRVEDTEQAHADRLSEIAFDSADKLAQAAEKQALAQGAALRELSSGLGDLERDTTRKAEEIGRKMNDALREAADDAARAVRDTIDRAQEAIQSATESQGLNRLLRGRRDEFSTGQEGESRTFSRGREDADLASRTVDERAKYALRVQADAAEVKRRRDREDADAEYALAQDLEDAKTDEQKAGIRVRFERQKQDRDRRRGQDDEDRRRRLVDDARALEDGFKKAADDLAKRRAAEQTERDFRKGQQQAAQAFSDTLENEALNRQIHRIITERDERIKEIGVALNEKQRKIVEQADQERETLNRSYQDKIADLKANFLDKVGPLSESTFGTLTTFLDQVAARIASVVAGATKITTPTAAAPSGGGGGALSAPLRPGGKPGETQAEVDAFNANAAKADADNRARASVNSGTPQSTQQLQAAGILGPNERLRNLASGGSFVVGGSGGVDSRRISFNATPGELLEVTPPGKSGGGGQHIEIHVHLPNATILGGDERELARRLMAPIRAEFLKFQAANGTTGIR